MPREGHSWMGMATGAGSEQGCVPGFEVWWEPTSGGSREPGRSVAQLQLEAVRRSAGCWALSHRGPWETLRREDLPYRDISGRSGVGVFEPGCWQGVLFPLGCGFGGLPGVAKRRRGNCSGILRRGFGKGLVWGPRQWHWHQLCASVAAVAAPCRDCTPQDRISQDLIHREVQDYYGRELQKSEDLKTNACVTLTRPVPKAVRDALQRVHEEVVARYYGCGLIIPECLESCRVLDLGSGSGRDCYVLSQLVGEQGHVTGIDMTEAQVEVAKKHIAYHMEKFGYQKPNVEFLQGYVENLGDVGLADESYDIVISNCVINLTPDKRAVLREAYRVLKPGGEMYFSDVYANQHLSEAMRKHRVLWGECLAGALFWRDLYSIAKEVGFSPPCLVTASPITVSNEELERIIGDCRFVSATFRLFKVPGSSRAGPGQVIYNGGIAGHERELVFDASFTFKVGEVVDVDAEMAAILQSSRFAEKFLIRAGGTDGAAPQGCCRGKMKEKICDPFLLLQQRAAPAPACGAAGTCGPQGCC